MYIHMDINMCVCVKNQFKYKKINSRESVYSEKFSDWIHIIHIENKFLLNM